MSLVKNNTPYKDKETPQWNSWKCCLRLQISLKANHFPLPKSVIAKDFPMPTDVIVRKLIPSHSSWGKQKYHPAEKNNTTTSYPLPHAFMKDTVRHNTAQMTSTIKAYVSCLLVIIIKWIYMITWNRLQHRYGGC